MIDDESSEDILRIEYAPYIYLAWFTTLTVTVFCGIFFESKHTATIFEITIGCFWLILSLWNLFLCGNNYIIINKNEIFLTTYGFSGMGTNRISIADIKSYSWGFSSYRSHSIVLNVKDGKIPIKANNIGWGTRRSLDVVAQAMEKLSITCSGRPGIDIDRRNTVIWSVFLAFMALIVLLSFIFKG